MKTIVFISCVSFGIILAAAITRVHVRAQTTLIGYELGQLKEKEARLLEKQSRLKMRLAKLTTRKHLSLLVVDHGGANEPNGPSSPTSPTKYGTEGKTLAARH